jgi:6-phosphogluconolactonase (cycloisomerase 2 family)
MTTASGRSDSARRRARLAVSTLAAIVAVAMPATAVAKDRHHSQANAGNVTHAFYAETNTKANALLVFRHNRDGRLSLPERVQTGGRGIAATPPFGFPTVDGSGSVNLTADGRLLFVVNAGDNTVSSFRVTASGPKLADRVSSGGVLPISLTSSGHLLYVLNELSGNIFGLRVSPNGHLTPIIDSRRALSTAGPSGVAAAIGFAPGGHILAVTERAIGVIDTFRIRSDGSPGVAQRHTAGAPQPFALGFAGSFALEVSNAGFVGTPPDTSDPAQLMGSVLSFNLASAGALTAAGSFGGPGALTATGNVASGGRATCWLVVTKDGRYLFTTNTLSDTVVDATTGKGAISRFSVAGDGKLTLLGRADTGPGLPSDEALSSDSHYLYVIEPTANGANTSHVDVYRVGSDGSLTHIQSTTRDQPRGISGAAAF